MDSDVGKLFIGGISWQTTEDKLSEYFGHFGEVSQALVIRDMNTGRPRGFGFVVFADPSVLDRVLQDKHSIDGRTVEAKRALSREEQQDSSRSSGRSGGRSSGGGGEMKTKKIFVGGLPPALTEDEFRQYFEAYGLVTDVVVMFDQTTQRPRGFGFITFDTEEAVDRVMHKSFHDLNGKTVEVKRALPKDANSGNGGYSAGTGGYQGHDSSGAGYSSQDSRMGGNGYMQQPQATGGNFAAYGPGYVAQGYGYGAMNNAVGYGGYGMGNYGMMGVGYSGVPGGYGNPNVQDAAYGNAQPGSENSWGYNSTAYGGAAAAYGNTESGYYGGQYGNQNNNGNEYTNTAWNQQNGAAGAQGGYANSDSQQAQQK